MCWDQMKRPRFVVADTMDLWLNIRLPELSGCSGASTASCSTTARAYQLTKEDNLLVAVRKIHRLGPHTSSSRKDHTAPSWSSPRGPFLCPAYPLTSVVDPTGAGDSFAGAMDGFPHRRERLDRQPNPAG